MKSIFDGWTKQSKSAADAHGGKCAYAFVTDRLGVSFMNQLPTDIQERFQQIGTWILRNMDVPKEKNFTWFSAIVWASDNGQLDPDGFRTVEKLVMGFVPEEMPTAKDEATHEMWLKEAGRE